MKKLLSLLIGFSMLAGCLTACQNTNTDSDGSKTDVTTTTVSDATPSETLENHVDDVSVDYSAAFSIEVLEDGIRRVKDGDNRELILVPKALGKIPDEYKDSTVITTPVENAVFLSSTQACMLRAAGKDEIWDTIGAVNGDSTSFTGLDAVSSRIDSGKIINIGNAMGTPDYEKIHELEPDVVFVYSGDSIQSEVIAKLDELKINYAVDNEYLENNYFARMEWMKFILSFYDEDDAAEEYMTKAQNTIDEIKSSISDINGKKVAMFSIFDGAAYGTSDSTWVGSMVKEMGGINVFGDVTEYTISMELLYDRAKDADVIIYSATPSFCSGIEVIKEAFPQIVECDAYENDRIYQFAEEYWMSIDRTDILAGDLAAVINPDIFTDRTLTYYAKMQK